MLKFRAAFTTISGTVLGASDPLDSDQLIKMLDAVHLETLGVNVEVSPYFDGKKSSRVQPLVYRQRIDTLLNHATWHQKVVMFVRDCSAYVTKVEA